MKRQSKEIGPCETQTPQLASEDFKAATTTMLDDINTYAKNQ